jgi:hypothetical protein
MNRDQINNADLTYASEIYQAATAEQWAHYVSSMTQAVLEYEQSEGDIDEAREVLTKALMAAGRLYDDAVEEDLKMYKKRVEKARNGYNGE